MFNPSHSTAKERSRFRALSAVMFVTVVASGGTMAACSNDSSTEPAQPQLVYGPAQNLGNGTARVYVKLDAAGKPASLGVALAENAMTNLPQMPMPGMPSAVMLILELPQAAKSTGFDHVMLDWNPAGHEPEHVYTLPHFDFHFYTMSQADQMAIVPSDPQFEAKMEKLPAAQYRPAGMIKLPSGVPMMGAHWVDPTSPELLPAPANKTFTGTFIYGSYDGAFIFYEPMITKAHIESVKSVAGNAITTAIKLPASYERPGYFPTKYSIAWDAASKEYRISLDSLVQRN